MNKCEDCGEEGKETTCPYAEEINGTTIEVILCDNCYHDRCMDI